MKENDTRISLINNDMTLVFTVLKPEDSGYYECIAENRVAKEIKAIEIDVLSKCCYCNILVMNIFLNYKTTYSLLKNSTFIIKYLFY